MRSALGSESCQNRVRIGSESGQTSVRIGSELSSNLLRSAARVFYEVHRKIEFGKRKTTIFSKKKSNFVNFGEIQNFTVIHAMPTLLNKKPMHSANFEFLAWFEVQVRPKNTKNLQKLTIWPFFYGVHHVASHTHIYQC